MISSKKMNFFILFQLVSIFGSNEISSGNIRPTEIKDVNKSSIPFRQISAGYKSITNLPVGSPVLLQYHFPKFWQEDKKSSELNSKKLERVIHYYEKFNHATYSYAPKIKKIIFTKIGNDHLKIIDK